LRVNIEARIVNVKAKLKTLQAASHTNISLQAFDRITQW
jgi:hypothetical protein